MIMNSRILYPLINTFAFICKDAESMRLVARHLVLNYGFQAKWKDEEIYGLTQETGQYAYIMLPSTLKIMRGSRYQIVFIDQDIYDDVCEDARGYICYTDMMIGHVEPVPFCVPPEIIMSEKEKNIKQ